ncbi:MAG: NADH:flavin oxidoreductase [Negativicutes bacterium]|nr:NADH:flavin oxidoreductase [Negativicutes bacterium]
MKSLFDQTCINNMKVKNRLVRAATWENMADSAGQLTDRLWRVYEELAAGEVGIILTSFAFILEAEQPSPGMLGIYADSFIAQYRKLTDMIHAYGSRVVLQIVYGGSQTGYRPESRTIWGPSAVPEFGTGVVPKEMTKEEINTLIKAFGDAARRAKAAGFDGVEIHAAHGYLLGQWLSPLHNHRQDEYGGSIENRGRLLFEVYEEVRRQVGSDYNIWIKINCEDFVPGGTEFGDILHVCRELARRGIDAIEMSGGILGAKELRAFRPNIDRPEKEAYFEAYAAQVAEQTKVPVILTGGLRTPEVMERILQQTGIEYFAMSRPLLAEAGLVRRWEKGDRTPSKCIYCNQCRSPQGNVCVLNRAIPEK